MPDFIKHVHLCYQFDVQLNGSFINSFSEQSCNSSVVDAVMTWAVLDSHDYPEKLFVSFKMKTLSKRGCSIWITQYVETIEAIYDHKKSSVGD